MPDLASNMPAALPAAQLHRINEGLMGAAFPSGDTDADRKRVAEVAGVENVQAMAIRGGERNPEDAWVVYVYFDERGSAVKGAFPYAELVKALSAGA